jgi:glutamine synthetase
LAEVMRTIETSGLSSSELQAGFFKRPGEKHPYLAQERAYRSEEDVFEHYSPAIAE